LYNFGDIKRLGIKQVLDDAVETFFDNQDEYLVKTLFMISNDMFGGNHAAFNEAVKKVLKFDGIVTNISDDEVFYVAFEPNQIKSAIGNKGTFNKRSNKITESEYRMQHTAPNKESGVPLHDLTANDNAVYPDDVYSLKGPMYYGSGDKADSKAFALARKLKDKPNGSVTIYRAVPPDVDAINDGDWVAITKEYAVEHGEGALKGDYKILTLKVKASQVYTNGDSIQEWGYDPS
jgi:hypothetical protein